MFRSSGSARGAGGASQYAHGHGAPARHHTRAATNTTTLLFPPLPALFQYLLRRGPRFAGLLHLYATFWIHELHNEVLDCQDDILENFAHNSVAEEPSAYKITLFDVLNFWCMALPNLVAWT